MSTRRVLLAIAAVIGLYYLAIGAVILRGRLSRESHLLWQFPLNGPRDLVPDMLDGGVVSCGSLDGLYWVDPGGREIAHIPVSDNEMLVAWISAGDLTVLTDKSGGPGAATGATLRAFDRLGRPLWQHQLPGQTGSCWITMSPDAVLVQRDGLELFKFSRDGKLLWRNAMPPNSSFVALAPDGRVLATDQNGDLQLFDQDFKRLGKGSGTSHYLYFAGDTLPAWAPDGSCRIADESSLSAVDKSGKLVWQHSAYASGSLSLNPFAIWLQSLSGSNYYPSTASWYGASLPAVDPASGSAYYGTPEGRFFAVDAQGQEIWTRRLHGAVRGAAVGPDGTVYVAATNSGVLAYTREGRLKWRNTGLRPISSALAIGSNGNVYVETDKALCCLAP